MASRLLTTAQRSLRRLLAAGFVLITGYAAATTFAQQITFSLGGFRPTGAEGRPDNGGDVLVNNQDFLLFNIDNYGFVQRRYSAADSSTPASASATTSRRPAIYRTSRHERSRHSAGLRLRSHRSRRRSGSRSGRQRIEPYIGGLGIFNYHYSKPATSSTSVTTASLATFVDRHCHRRDPRRCACSDRSIRLWRRSQMAER